MDQLRSRYLMELVEIRVEARDDDPRARELDTPQQARQDIQQGPGGRHSTEDPPAGPDGLSGGVEDIEVVDCCRASPDRVEPREHTVVRVSVGDQRGAGDTVLPRMFGGQRPEPGGQPAEGS